jgi:hypothetical protein
MQTAPGALESQSFGLYSTLQLRIFDSSWLDFNSIRDDDAQKGSSPPTVQKSMLSLKPFNTKDDWATDLIGMIT